MGAGSLLVHAWKHFALLSRCQVSMPGMTGLSYKFASFSSTKLMHDAIGGNKDGRVLQADEQVMTREAASHPEAEVYHTMKILSYA